MTLSRFTAAFLAVGASTLLIPATAFAADPETVVRGERSDEIPVAYVKYRDINLGSAEGVDALRARVRRAANAMCIERGTVDLARQFAGWRCRDAAIASAEPQIASAAERFASQQVASAAPIAIRMYTSR